jgi:hypothetical protein
MDVIPEEADFVIQEVLHVHSVSYTEFSGRWPCHEPEVYRLGVEQLVREFRLPPCHEPPIEIGKMPLPMSDTTLWRFDIPETMAELGYARWVRNGELQRAGRGAVVGGAHTSCV